MFFKGAICIETNVDDEQTPLATVWCGMPLRVALRRMRAVYGTFSYNVPRAGVKYAVYCGLAWGGVDLDVPIPNPIVKLTF